MATMTAEAWAAEIVGQMSPDDRGAIIRAGDADAWAAGIDAMTWDVAQHGPRPDTSDVVREVERLVLDDGIYEVYLAENADGTPIGEPRFFVERDRALAAARRWAEREGQPSDVSGRFVRVMDRAGVTWDFERTTDGVAEL